MTKAEYLANPCAASSLPYWKSACITIPNEIQIIHMTDTQPAQHAEKTAVRYFRLIHRLGNIEKPALPDGFDVIPLTPKQAAFHIRQCYTDIGISEEELAEYRTRSVFDETLWIALQERSSGRLVASAIAELDSELSEGILEWIQVSPNARKKGFGSFIVRELLWRMQKKADFVTVSGKLDDPCCPEQLYRHCGFSGNDIWIISRRETYGN